MLNKLDLLFAMGRPLSPVYSWLMSTRAALYKKNIFRRFTLPIPVISIGNLTMGGSGKTPMVMSLASRLKRHGYHPAIISRGYGGKANRKYNIVSRGTEILLSPEDAGDEPFMLAKNLPGVPVITGKSRIHPCKYAIDKLNVDVLLLDDGFQHLSINRDVDIVLFNATTLAGNSRVFPGGILREPVNALSRCDVFVLTGVNETNRKRAKDFSTLLANRFPETPLFFSSISEYEVWSADDNKAVKDLQAIGKVSAFCAIANPVRFRESIGMTGIEMVQFTPLRDHRQYSQGSIDRLCEKAISSGARTLLTTEKDYVKIHHLKSKIPLHVLKVKYTLDEDFNKYILNAIDKTA